MLYIFLGFNQIKHNKLKFSTTNIGAKRGGIYGDVSYIPVTNKTESPRRYDRQKNQAKENIMWKLSKESFIKNLYNLMTSLYAHLIKKEESC